MKHADACARKPLQAALCLLWCAYLKEAMYACMASIQSLLSSQLFCMSHIKDEDTHSMIQAPSMFIVWMHALAVHH